MVIWLLKPQAPVKSPPVAQTDFNCPDDDRLRAKLTASIENYLDEIGLRRSPPSDGSSLLNP